MKDPLPLFRGEIFDLKLCLYERHSRGEDTSYSYDIRYDGDTEWAHKPDPREDLDETTKDNADDHVDESFDGSDWRIETRANAKGLLLTLA